MKNKVALWIVISIVLLMGLSACGAVQSVSAVNDLGKNFMTALRNNDAATSWYLLTEDVQKEVGGQEAWVEFVKPRNFSEWSFTNTQVNSNGAQIDGEAVLGGDTYTMVLVFDKSDDTWLISGINFTYKQ